MAGILLSILPSAAASAKRDTALESALATHISVLASNDYGGREPGTPGEAKTLRYLARQWFDIGLVSGTNDAGHEWFAPVTFVARAPAASNAVFLRKGKRMVVPTGDVLILTSGKRSLVENAPLVFVGKGQVALSRNELAGRVAVLLSGPSDDGTRQNALIKAGAGAVLTVLDGERTIAEVASRRKRSGYALASDAIGGDLEGFITASAFGNLIS
ncbi:MAG: peptidase M28, partial [Novosphingobium sp.]